MGREGCPKRSMPPSYAKKSKDNRLLCREPFGESGAVSIRLLSCVNFFLGSLVFVLIGFSEVGEMAHAGPSPVDGKIAMGLRVVLVSFAIVFGLSGYMLWKRELRERTRKLKWALAGVVLTLLLSILSTQFSWSASVVRQAD